MQAFVLVVHPPILSDVEQDLVIAGVQIAQRRDKQQLVTEGHFAVHFDTPNSRVGAVADNLHHAGVRIGEIEFALHAVNAGVEQSGVQRTPALLRFVAEFEVIDLLFVESLGREARGGVTQVVAAGAEAPGPVRIHLCPIAQGVAQADFGRPGLPIVVTGEIERTVGEALAPIYDIAAFVDKIANGRTRQGGQIVFDTLVAGQRGDFGVFFFVRVAQTERQHQPLGEFVVERGEQTAGFHAVQAAAVLNDRRGEVAGQGAGEIAALVIAEVVVEPVKARGHVGRPELTVEAQLKTVLLRVQPGL